MKTYYFEIDTFTFGYISTHQIRHICIWNICIVPKYLRYCKDKYWVTRLWHLIFTTCHSNCLMRITWRVRSGTGVEHVGARAKSVMRKKVYRVTFSIRDACDVRSFRLSFLDRVSNNFERVVFDTEHCLFLVSLMSNVCAIFSVCWTYLV